MGKEEVNIIWTKKAKDQFFNILEYWINRNKSDTYALKLIDEVDEKLSFISHNPLASTLTSFPNTRKCSMKHYSLLYKIDKGIIYITAFWDNRQDPFKLDQILKE